MTDYNNFIQYMKQKYPNMTAKQQQQLQQTVQERQQLSTAQSLLESGQLKPSDIPAEQRLEVLGGVSSLPSEQSGYNTIEDLPAASERNQARELLARQRQLNEALNVLGYDPETGKSKASTGFLTNITSPIAQFLGRYGPSEQLRDELVDIVQQIRKEKTGVQFAPEEQQELEEVFGSLKVQEEPLYGKLSRTSDRTYQQLLDLGLSPEAIEAQTSGRAGVDSGLDDEDEALINKYKKQ